MINDFRLAIRRLSRNPSFTLVAFLTLVLGVGANAAVYSVVHGVLLKPLPFHDPGSLLLIWTRHPSTDRYPFQLPEFIDYRDGQRTLSSFAAFATWSAGLSGDGEDAARLQGLRVSANFFELLGARAVVGRTLRADDDKPGQEKVAVLGHGLWQRRFGGDPGVVGRTLILNNEPFTVVGVVGPEFLFPIRTAEVAVPLAPDADPFRHNRRSTNFIRVLARARPGTSVAEVTADLDSIAARLRQEFPDSYGMKTGVHVSGLAEELTSGVRSTLLLLQGAVALLLVLAAANLANLVLVRATERHGEIAIHQALGASRGRLVRHLVAETAVLALCGAAGALLFARFAVAVLVALSPTAMPRTDAIGLSPAVLLVTMATAAAVAVLATYAPVARVTRTDPQVHLRAVGRGGLRSAESARTQRLLMTTQVALMVMLLSSAGLLFKSFREVMRVDPGFATDVLTVRLSLPRKDYGRLDRMSAMYRDLDSRVRALPGVLAVATVNQFPLNGSLASAEYKIPSGPPVDDRKLPTAVYRAVTPEFFRTLAVPIRAGRAFEEGDREGVAPVAIVSEGLVRRSFAGRNAVGEEILVQDNPGGFRPLRIVGVAADVRHGSLELEEAEPHLYVSYHQVPANVVGFLNNNQYLLVRTGGAALSLAEGVRRELKRVDPNIAAADVRLSGWYVDAAAGGRRFAAQLVAVFASLAVLLAAIGIYGVMSYTVARRSREIGVRRALGADARSVAVLVLGEGVRRSVAGAVVGTVAALAAAFAFRAMLFGVPASDPAMFMGAVLLVFFVTVAASLPPAWRAARVDPAATLRAE